MDIPNQVNFSLNERGRGGLPSCKQFV